jgi:protein TonB
MRISTFFVSFLVHSLVIGAVMVARIMATGVLPVPPRTTTFVVVTPELPTVPPPPAPRRPSSTPPVPTNAAPIVEPPEIRPEPILAVNDTPVDGELIVGVGDVPGALVSAEPVAPPPRPALAPAPVRIGGEIRPPQKIHHVVPEYPAIARSAQVSGIVILEAVIAEDGTVRDVKVLRSVRLLDDAAVDAVRQWRFTPTLLNGEPVPVVMAVTVAFNLN